MIINNMKFFKVPDDPESKEMPDRTGTDLDAGLYFRTYAYSVKNYINLFNLQSLNVCIMINLFATSFEIWTQSFHSFDEKLLF